MRALRTVAALSAIYDGLLGAGLLLAAEPLAAVFGVPPVRPAIFGDTNGLFLVAIGAGYLLPYRDPVRYRAYLWLMGPWLKGLGALAFVRDYFVRSSPTTFLLFALSDGLLAVATLWALLATRPGKTA